MSCACYRCRRGSEQKRFAESRLKDAQVLFRNRQFDGAYYLAGYAVECALKACVAKKIKRYDFPDKDLALRVYTHNLTKLLEPAGVLRLSGPEIRTVPALDAKWGVVKDWNEQSRYEKQGRKKAKAMLDAVEGPQGILECIKEYW